MQETFDISGRHGNGIEPFFPRYIQSVPQGGFLCSPEHGKLCFEALETEIVPQNNLPLQGAENTLRSRGFVRIKMDLL